MGQISLNVEQFLQSGAFAPIHEQSFAVGWGKRIHVSLDEIAGRPVFYSPGFFNDAGTPYFTHENTAAVPLRQLQELFPEGGPFSDCEWEITHEKEFENSFEDLHDYFKEGKLKKGVPYLFYRNERQVCRDERKSILGSVLNRAPERKLYPYGFWSEGSGTIGATPEILFTYSKGELVTEACAGTARPGEPLEGDEKMLDEHRYVVEGICRGLSSFGLLKRGTTRRVDFGSISHLVTPLTIEIGNEASPHAITDLLHPTPALGAYPKPFGMEWLVRYGKLVPRGFYGAPFGVVTDEKTAIYVAIRNLQWDLNGRRIGVGCGIVAGSELEKEKEELQIKFRSVKELLNQ